MLKINARRAVPCRRAVAGIAIIDGLPVSAARSAPARAASLSWRCRPMARRLGWRHDLLPAPRILCRASKAMRIWRQGSVSRSGPSPSSARISSSSPRSTIRSRSISTTRRRKHRSSAAWPRAASRQRRRRSACRCAAGFWQKSIWAAAGSMRSAGCGRSGRTLCCRWSGRSKRSRPTKPGRATVRIRYEVSNAAGEPVLTALVNHLIRGRPAA